VEIWPKEWKFYERSQQTINVAADYGSNSGLYTAQFDMSSKAAYLGLLASHTDVSSLAVYLALTLSNAPNEVTPSAAISLYHLDSNNDLLTVGYNYETSGGSSSPKTSDIFSLVVSPSTGALQSQSARL
jgi:hypothetical protein